MLTTDMIRSFKKTNASKDSEKSKLRISEDFKTTNNNTKYEIIDLSGQTRSSFYRTFETGNASLKTILSMAQVLNVSPYYYSGAEDDKGSCSEEVLINFLKDYGYHDLIADLRATRSRKKRGYKKASNIPDVEYEADENNEPVDIINEDTVKKVKNDEKFTVPIDSSSKMQDAIASLNEETAILLLKALFKRAEAGGNAETLSNTVKHCLLS